MNRGRLPALPPRPRLFRLTPNGSLRKDGRDASRRTTIFNVCVAHPSGGSDVHGYWE